VPHRDRDGARRQLRITLAKNTGIARPWAETPSHVITMAFDPDLDLAAASALREMIAPSSAQPDFPPPMLIRFAASLPICMSPSSSIQRHPRDACQVGAAESLALSLD
jgi:hypothetical protein